MIQSGFELPTSHARSGRSYHCTTESGKRFCKHCKDFYSVNESLIILTTSCWLSRGNLVRRSFDLRMEMREFFDHDNGTKKTADFVTKIDDPEWELYPTPRNSIRATTSLLMHSYFAKLIVACFINCSSFAFECSRLKF